MKRLQQESFRLVGEMKLTATGIRVHMHGDAPRQVPGVYAFVIDRREAGYIGSSNGWAGRVWTYGYDFGVTYATRNRRVNDEMRRALEAGARVDVWVCTDVMTTLPSGTMVCHAGGLEEALIRKLRPAWNVLGVAPRSQWAGGAAALTAAARKARQTTAIARGLNPDGGSLRRAAA